MARKKKVVEVTQEDVGVPSYPVIEQTIVEGYSNAVASADGKITCTIKHVELGELPYTYCPHQTDVISRQLGKLLEADGVVHEDLDECPSVKYWENKDARIWRNSELSRADVIINKIEDFEIEGDSKPWRQYRATLRNWPATEDFPATKPTAPDA